MHLDKRGYQSQLHITTLLFLQETHKKENFTDPVHLQLTHLPCSFLHRASPQNISKATCQVMDHHLWCLPLSCCRTRRKEKAEVSWYLGPVPRERAMGGELSHLPRCPSYPTSAGAWPSTPCSRFCVWTAYTSSLHHHIKSPSSHQGLWSLAHSSGVGFS